MALSVKEPVIEAGPVINGRYAIYNGDCIKKMAGMPDASVDLSIHSPPFAGLYIYSSDPADLSNCDDMEQFMKHYSFVVEQLTRITKPGRMAAVHCMDIPASNTGNGDSYIDFPGEIIRLYERHGWRMSSPRRTIWKEPLEVRNRTLTKALAHRTIVEDANNTAAAGADYVLVFRNKGKNLVPIAHDHGLIKYAGASPLPPEVLRYKGWTGNQIENRYSHQIWRRYASSVWGDIRIDRVLPYIETREDEDEKHVHPLQLDVIERLVELHSNPGEVVFTPFMGVGSEVYGAVANGRRGIGVELKKSYFLQAVKNMATCTTEEEDTQNQFDFGAVGDEWLSEEEVLQR